MSSFASQKMGAVKAVVTGKEHAKGTRSDQAILVGSRFELCINYSSFILSCSLILDSGLLYISALHGVFYRRIHSLNCRYFLKSKERGY